MFFWLAGFVWHHLFCAFVCATLSSKATADKWETELLTCVQINVYLLSHSFENKKHYTPSFLVFCFFFNCQSIHGSTCRRLLPLLSSYSDNVPFAAFSQVFWIVQHVLVLVGYTATSWFGMHLTSTDSL